MTRRTEAERAAVRDFVVGLYEAWAAQQEGPISWAEFARQAGVNYGSLNTWKAAPPAKKRGTPEALDMLRMMRAAGVIDGEGLAFDLPLAGRPGDVRRAVLPRGQRMVRGGRDLVAHEEQSQGTRRSA